VNKAKEVHPAVAQITQILDEKDAEILKLKMEIESLRQQLKSGKENSIGKEKLTGGEKDIRNEELTGGEKDIHNEELTVGEKTINDEELTVGEKTINDEELADKKNIGDEEFTRGEKSIDDGTLINVKNASMMKKISFMKNRFQLFFNKFKQFVFYKHGGLVFIVPIFLLMMNRK
jgi:hypothetical protein